MLNLPQAQHGVTMIELLVGLAIMAILLAIGAPALNTWVQNGKIRLAAEAIQGGLQLAKSEAVHRNTTVRFELVDTISNACVTSTTSSSWVVSQRDTIGRCGSTPSDSAAAPDPLIVQTRTGLEGGTTSLTVSATQSLIAFNGLGRQAVVTDGTTTPNPVVAVNIDISNAAGGTPLRVMVSQGGQIRMCDPAYTQASDPRGC